MVNGQWLEDRFISENPERNQSIFFSPNRPCQDKSRAKCSEFHPESNARELTSRNSRGRCIPCHPANSVPCRLWRLSRARQEVKSRLAGNLSPNRKLCHARRND